MKLSVFLSVIFLLIIIVYNFFPHPTITVFEGYGIKIPYKVSIGKKLTEREKEIMETLIEDTFKEIHDIYNKWNSLSEISKINQAQANCPLTLSPALATFLKKIDQIVSMTEGKFDPTVEPLQNLWKQHLENDQTTPSLQEIEEVLSYVGWNHIHINDNTLLKDDHRVQLDFGGIAKGLWIDNLFEKLKNLGYPDFLIEWGGEFRAYGHHPSKRAWSIQIISLHKISLIDQAIATSGNYFQNWKVQNATYTHIFDPKTGFPLQVHDQNIASATVVAPTCVEADALATASMVFSSVELAQQWKEKNKTVLPFEVFLQAKPVF